ncbi:MAG: hypothetical protein U0271_47210 [Polyangiaceae bacterium]
MLAASPLALFACSSTPDAKKPVAETRRLEFEHESCGSGDQVDVNGDKNPDIETVTSGGRKVCRAIDLNFDGVKDAFIYYDENGNERRRESDYDRDGRPDVVVTFVNGQKKSAELETNFDGKIDTWETYENGRLAKAERDSDGDGLIDEWWSFDRPDQPDCATVYTDRNADGQPDPDTGVDMCGEGYKAPVFTNTPTASASATTSSTAAKPATSAPATSSSSAGSSPATSASAAPSSSTSNTAKTP